MRRARYIHIAGLAAAMLLPWPAQAHMVSTGIGPFYDGMTHVFVTPLDLLCLAASILLAGLAGVARARLYLAAMIGAWSAGVPFGAWMLDAPWPMDTTLSLGLVLCGAMVALDRRWPRGTTLLLLTGLNAALALNAGAGIRTESEDPLLAMLGILASIGQLSVLGTAFAVSRPSTWQRVALRAAGSWIAAIGLLAWAAMESLPGAAIN